MKSNDLDLINHEIKLIHDEITQFGISLAEFLKGKKHIIDITYFKILQRINPNFFSVMILLKEVEKNTDKLR